MSRYIDGNVLKANINTAFWSEIGKLIDNAPSIDIVFCKECKWADWYKTADGKQFCYCMETGSAGRTADDFCSYGEREGE